MEETNMRLVVDSKDNYLGEEDMFYIHPQRLSQVRCLEDNQFSSCKILNSGVENISSLNLNYIFKKLQPEAKCEVTIFQPISVMQEYDAKQVEANARLAGFTDITISEDKKAKTLKVECFKPIKENNYVELQVERRSGSLKYVGKNSLKNVGKAYN